MLKTVLRFAGAVLAALIAIAFLAAPAANGQNPSKPDYVSSDNIELVDRIKTVGDGVGARVVGDYLYVTSTKSLSIFDIKTNPEKPAMVGTLTLDVEFENEEVPTNGKILGISGQIGCKDPTNANVITDNPLVGNQPSSTDEATGCLSLYDVSNPAAVRFIRSVSGAGDHTSACVLDCQYFWGDDGAVTDARKPAEAKVIGNWTSKLPKRDYDGNPSTAPTTFAQGCHFMREIQPGIIFGACQPLFIFSVRPEDGGSITEPVILGEGQTKDLGRFIHSNQWPRDGADKFALAGGETNANPECDDTENTAAFMVFDTLGAIDGKGGFQRPGVLKMISEVRPKNGNYFNGNTPYNGLGCSVHWFQHNPAFRDGGAVALAEYENGTRLLQVTSAGKIIEQGFFLPLGGSTSAPHWHPNGKVIYAIDYTRGVDVLRYKGPTYAPDAAGNVVDEPGTVPGTNGRTTPEQAKAIADLRAREREQAQSCSLIATNATARRSGRGLALGAGGATFDAQVFQLSRGRSVIRKKRVVRYRGATGERTWNGRTPRGKALPNGFYLVRISTGGKTRQLTFEKRRGRFVARPDFQTGSSCGALRGFQLRSPVFGGRKNVAASVAFRLTRAAEMVQIRVMRNGKVVRTVTRRKAAANRTYKLSVSARGLKRGTYTFRIIASRANKEVLAQAQLHAARL